MKPVPPQPDLFGQASAPKSTRPKPARAPKALEEACQPEPPPASPPAPSLEPPPTADVLASRLSPAELDELAALLDDDGLARLTLAAVRQMRRRLSRGRRGDGVAPALRRAYKQLATELGGGSSE